MLTAGAAEFARAQTTPTLTGEVVNLSVTETASLNCTDAANGTLTYTASGAALGPYPGTATETGTLVFAGGFVTSFHATFTIQSGATTITGMKQLSFANSAGCMPAQGTMSAQFATRYDATIKTPTETLDDRGAAAVVLEAARLATGETIVNGQETFGSDREAAHPILSPTQSVNPVGTMHTVTALLRDEQFVPVQGATLLWTVTGSSSETGQCITGPDGTCNFSYLGPAVPGADVITACHDFDHDGTISGGEQCGDATKAWEETTGGPGRASGGGYITDATTTHRVVFGFHAQVDIPTPTGSCQVIDQAAGVTIRCLDVALFLITGTHALITGEAMVNGVATNYRINVDDVADPGEEADTFSIETDSAGTQPEYSASGTVEHGNIQVNP